MAVHDLSPLVVALSLMPVNARQLPQAVPSYNPRRRVMRDFGGDSNSGPTLDKAGKSSILELERPPKSLQPPLSPAPAANLRITPKTHSRKASLGSAATLDTGSVLSVANTTAASTVTGGMSKAAAAAEASQQAHARALEATKATELQLAKRGVTTHVPMLQDPSKRPYLVRAFLCFPFLFLGDNLFGVANLCT